MAEQKKAVCGGFYIGDGLEMDGKTLYATGSSGGGVKEFEVRPLFGGYVEQNAVIVGADIEDLKGIFRLYVVDTGDGYQARNYFDFCLSMSGFDETGTFYYINPLASISGGLEFDWLRNGFYIKKKANLGILITTKEVPFEN